VALTTLDTDFRRYDDGKKFYSIGLFDGTAIDDFDVLAIKKHACACFLMD
jgi:hypothetical protein